jgi:hypothetical protein
MPLDTVRGAEIERAVRAVYQYALRDRWLDEADIECMEIAINQQVILVFLEACLKNKVLLSEQDKEMFAESTGVLNYCLQELKCENPYGQHPN